MLLEPLLLLLRKLYVAVFVCLELVENTLALTFLFCFVISCAHLITRKLLLFSLLISVYNMVIGSKSYVNFSFCNS